LYVRHEYIRRSEGRFENVLKFLPVDGFIGAVGEQVWSDIERDRICLFIETERGGREENEETDMWESVRDKLGRRTAQWISNLNIVHNQ